MKVPYNLKILDYLFFFPPIFAFLMYLIGGDQFSGMTFMVANIIGTILLIALTPQKVNKKFLIIVALYFLLYLFYGEQIEGAKIYLCSTLYTFILLLYFGNNSYLVKGKNDEIRLDRLIGAFTIILIVGQLLTIDNPMQFIRLNYSSVDEDALDKKGFLISHAFGYYLSALTMYYAYRKKILYMVILSILCFLFSRRTVVLMCALGWLYYLNERFGKKTTIIASVLLVFVAITYMGTTAYFGDFSFSLDPDDNESAAFTSGRSRFWGTFVYFKLLSGRMPIWEYLLGDGPATSRNFNEIYSGIKVWMHNDFFDILYCLGIVGLILYVYAIYRSCKKLGLYFGIFLLLSANLNGFMLYQTYPIVYLFAVIKAFENYDSKFKQR